MGGPRTIKKIHIFWWFGVGGPTFSCSYWNQVDLVWVAQEMLEKHMYLDDLVWVAPLFAIHIEEISLFSMGGPRNIEKIHIFW